MLPPDIPAIPSATARIVFLHGCAEPGRDGVGDYAALLAAECERRGHPTLRIALNDPHGSSEQPSLLRLAASTPWPARVEQARDSIARFNPDLVSLQWVPYSFHPRGIPWGIEKALARIISARPVHVMCHEIWIGAEAGATLVHRLTGAAQRAVMRRIFRTLRPHSIHTSNPAYAALLQKSGIDASILPLFGSIPVTAAESPRDQSTLRFGMFGELHPIWPPEPLLGHLRTLGKSVEIHHIGRIGKGDPLWREMERLYGADFRFQRHGEQPAERISQFLMDIDFGIAPTPLALIGKSATAAAMLEHGLPVIVNRDDIHYRGIHPGPMPEGVILMDENLPAALQSAHRRPPRSRLPEVADQFLKICVNLRQSADKSP